jgi:hypothetical protein
LGRKLAATSKCGVIALSMHSVQLQPIRLGSGRVPDLQLHTKHPNLKSLPFNKVFLHDCFAGDD